MTEKDSIKNKKWYYKNQDKKLAYYKIHRQTVSGRYTIYKSNARAKGFKFEISIKEFESIVRLPCVYCGLMPNPFNGIDRKDNCIGYVLENCSSCCSKCNWMKCDSSVEDFLKKCSDIARHNMLL